MKLEDGLIDYNDLLDALNWRQNPVSNPLPRSREEQSDFSLARHTDDIRMLDETTHERKKFNVEYSAMLKDLGLNMSSPSS